MAVHVRPGAAFITLGSEDTRRVVQGLGLTQFLTLTVESFLALTIEDIDSLVQSVIHRNMTVTCKLPDLTFGILNMIYRNFLDFANASSQNVGGGGGAFVASVALHPSNFLSSFLRPPSSSVKTLVLKACKSKKLQKAV